jgi:creatinine amidohydrolase
MRYGDCRWVDVEEMDKDKVVVVCPVAALEQHGHHLPLLTDTYLVTEVAERVERALPDEVMLTPTLWVGASDHHLDFPGTVSLPNTLYVEVLKQVVRCYVQAGFRRILLLNGHGGNIAPGTVAITELANSCDDVDGLLLAFSSYWELAGYDSETHGLETAFVSHACEYETSMMLVVKGELVHMDQAQAGSPVIESPFYHSELGGKVTVAGRFHRLTPTGAMGSPEKATTDKGETLLSAGATEVVKFIEEFLTWDHRIVLKP